MKTVRNWLIMKKGVRKYIISILITLCIILIAGSVSAAPACFSNCGCANWPSKNMPTCGSWITGCCKITSPGTYTLGNNIYGAYTVSVPDYDSSKKCKFTCLKIDSSGVTLDLNNKEIEVSYSWYPSSDAWADDAYAMFIRKGNVHVKDGTLDRYHYPIVLTGNSWGSVTLENILFKNGPGFGTSRNIRDQSSNSGSNKLIFSNTNGEVELTGSIGANRYSGTVGLNNGVTINSNSISVEGSSGWAHYWSGSSAHIEFYGLTGITSPIIKKNGANCGSSCTNVQQVGETVSFDINSIGSGTPVFTVVSGCKNNGDTCTANSQCCNNKCVDGVCCNEACTGSCQRCDSYDGTAGTCHFIADGNDPDNECTTTPGCDTNCDSNILPGNCNGFGACQDYVYSVCTPGTSCQAASGTCEVTTELCDAIDHDCDGDPYNGFECALGSPGCDASCNLICNNVCENRYQYISSTGSKNTQKTNCNALGAGWHLTHLDYPEEYQGYLQFLDDLKPLSQEDFVWVNNTCNNITQTWPEFPYDPDDPSGVCNVDGITLGWLSPSGPDPEGWYFIDRDVAWSHRAICELDASPAEQCEICNGIDDDCDGLADDGFECVLGSVGCDASCSFLDCNGNPIGTIRSCYTGPPETEGVGTCINGTETCLAGGTWTPCAGEVVPQTESIASGNCGDGLNNDCDSEQDWDLSDLIHGEQDCPIEITAISVGSPPN